MRQPTPERFGDDGGQCLPPFCGAPLEFADDVIWKNKRSFHMDNHTRPCFLLQVPMLQELTVNGTGASVRASVPDQFGQNAPIRTG
jgi:hypothetical protein